VARTQFALLFRPNSFLQFTEHCLRKNARALSLTELSTSQLLLYFAQQSEQTLPFLRHKEATFLLNVTYLRGEPALTTFFAFSALQEMMIQANLEVSLFQSNVITGRI